MYSRCYDLTTNYITIWIYQGTESAFLHCTTQVSRPSIRTQLIHNTKSFWGIVSAAIPLQTAPAVAWGAPLQGCPGSPAESWPSSSSEPRFYTPAGRLSPPLCTMRNRGSRGLWFKTRDESEVSALCGLKDSTKRGTTHLTSPNACRTRKHKAGPTVDDMLRRNGLLVWLVAYFICFRGNEVDELRAAINNKLPGVVCHSYVGERFFNHLVDRCPGDGEVIVVSRGGSHRGREKINRPKSDGNTALWLSGEAWMALPELHTVYCLIQDVIRPKCHQTEGRFLQVSRLASLLTKLMVTNV